MRHFRFLRAAPVLAASLGLASIMVGRVASAQDTPPEAPTEGARPAPAPPPPPPPTTPTRPRYVQTLHPDAAPPEEPATAPSPKAVQYRWSFEVSARTLRFKNNGYEAFTTSEALPMATFGAYYGLLTQGPLSLHVGGQWSVGGIDGSARSQATSLTVHHFGLGLLGRYRITHWLFPAVRVVPLAQYTSASLRPDESPSRFDSKGFAFGVDATAGVHFVPFTIGDVEAARALGQRTPVIWIKHIVPNVSGPLIVVSTSSMASMILAESVLSYLSVGVQPPTATWGRMLAEGQRSFTAAPHLVVAPAVAILIAVLAFNLVGEGLRDALDARDRA